MSDGATHRAGWWTRLVIRHPGLVPFLIAAVATPVLLWLIGYSVIGTDPAGVIAWLAMLALGTVGIGLPAYALLGLPLFWVVLTKIDPASIIGTVLLLALAGPVANLGTYPLYVLFTGHDVAVVIATWGFPAAAETGVVFALIYRFGRRAKRLLRPGRADRSSP